jgi:predicted nuclease of predicted toxin-antitoxin system
MMRFLADENVARVVAARLRAAGLDVAAIAETAAGASDEQVLAIAVADQRILITEDRDFGELIVRQRMAVGGIVLLELDPLSNDAAAARVVDVVSAHAARLPGNLVVIEPGRVRIRPLAHRSR